MAPSKKKKRFATNPARGFATTSIPSKASETSTSTEQADAHGQSRSVDEQNVIESQTSKGNSLTVSKAPAPSKDIHNMSSNELHDHLVDAELQSILDTHRARCSGEATRAVARFRAERRTLRLHAVKVFTRSWLPDVLVNDIVRTSASYDLPLSTMTSSATMMPTQDQVLTKLWVLAQILAELHFPHIDQALEYVIRSWLFGSLVVSKEDPFGLPESLEWYATYVDIHELPSYESPQVVSSRITEDEDDTPQYPGNGTGIDYEHESPSAENTDIVYLEVDIESDDDNDPGRLSEKFLRLKRLLLFSERRVEGQVLSAQTAARLQQRLKEIQADVLFDSSEAYSLWQEQERELQLQAANRKKLDIDDRAARTQLPLDGEEQSKEANDLLESESGLEGIFTEMLTHDETDTPNSLGSSTTNENSLLELIDFGEWAGVHPRRLLDDVLKSRDARAQIQLVQVSSVRHVNRHRMKIIWSSEQPEDQWLADSLPSQTTLKVRLRTLQIEMVSIATPSSKQSEAYVSTVALFAVCARSPNNQKITSRLPPVWRELWSDMSRQRQDAIDRSDKTTLKKLQQMIDAVKVRHSGDPSAVIQASINESHYERAEPHQHQSSRGVQSSKTIQSEWSKRASASKFHKMLSARRELPIFRHKDEILDTIASNAVTILCAETGAGKSTQVPSFVLEQAMGLGENSHILVTQPRRISAITLARRVSQELGENLEDLGSHKSLVGYAIRLESRTSASTRITFATTGILLRMLESSPNLAHLSHVILDEIHERTMDLDLLLIAVRRLLRTSPTLKLILMSATIDSQKLSDYFDGAPILNISGRTYAVEVGFLEDAIEATIDHLAVGPCKSIENGRYDSNEEDGSDAPDTGSRYHEQTASLRDYNVKTRSFLESFDEYRIDYSLITQLACKIASHEQYEKYSSAILIFMPGLAEIRRLHSALVSERAFSTGWVIHLLHSTFSSEDLERAFTAPPRGSRKIVIATNIAETGITIPDITAVIDTCKEKVMRYDERRQSSKLVESFVSRSSSRQRRGRAARVQEGLCFHLVTRYRYESLMPEQHVPEMLRLSLQDPILRAKIWNLGDISSTLGSAIDPPSPKNIRRAIEALKDVGALSKSEELTPLGRQLALLPVDVELGKLVILGIFFKCLDPTITMAALLSSPKSIFVGMGQNQSSINSEKSAFKTGDSDLMYSYRVFQAWKRASQAGTARKFCVKYSLNEHVLSQIEDQKVQLLVAVADAGLLTLTEGERQQLRIARISNSRRQSFEVPDRYQTASMSDECIHSVIAMAFYPRLLSREGKGWRNVATNQPVKVTSDSINKADGASFKWMSFYQAIQTKSGGINVVQTSSVPELAILLLLGQAEFRLYSGVVKVDSGRLLVAVTDWKSMIAIRFLRIELARLLNAFFESPARAVEADDLRWYNTWLAIIGRKAKTPSVTTD